MKIIMRRVEMHISELEHPGGEKEFVRLAQTATVLMEDGTEMEFPLMSGAANRIQEEVEKATKLHIHMMAQKI